LTIEQALADYALLLSELPTLVSCDLGSCNTVLFGGSYGGMLAAWHRLKYPHLSVGAIAAGAPVDLYPGQGKQQLFWEATLHTFTRYGNFAGVTAEDFDCGYNLDLAINLTRAYMQSPSNRSLVSEVLESCNDMATDELAEDNVVFYIKV
jgi:dipeptidyl-peptidase-2